MHISGVQRTLFSSNQVPLTSRTATSLMADPTPGPRGKFNRNDYWCCTHAHPSGLQFCLALSFSWSSPRPHRRDCGGPAPPLILDPICMVLSYSEALSLPSQAPRGRISGKSGGPITESNILLGIIPSPQRSVPLQSRSRGPGEDPD